MAGTASRRFNRGAYPPTHFRETPIQHRGREPVEVSQGFSSTAVRLTACNLGRKFRARFGEIMVHPDRRWKRRWLYPTLHRRLSGAIDSSTAASFAVVDANEAYAFWSHDEFCLPMSFNSAMNKILYYKTIRFFFVSRTSKMNPGEKKLIVLLV